MFQIQTSNTVLCSHAWHAYFETVISFLLLTAFSNRFRWTLNFTISIVFMLLLLVFFVVITSLYYLITIQLAYPSSAYYNFNNRIFHLFLNNMCIWFFQIKVGTHAGMYKYQRVVRLSKYSTWKGRTFFFSSSVNRDNWLKKASCTLEWVMRNCTNFECGYTLHLVMQ